MITFSTSGPLPRLCSKLYTELSRKYPYNVLVAPNFSSLYFLREWSNRFVHGNATDIRYAVARSVVSRQPLVGAFYSVLKSEKLCDALGVRAITIFLEKSHWFKSFHGSCAIPLGK